MKLSELFEDSTFGISGVRKNDLNHFLGRAISGTLKDMEAPSDVRRLSRSIAKRMTGTLIPNLYHIRNAVIGKNKLLRRRLNKYMVPYIKSTLRASITDHPELKALDAEEFIPAFIDEIINNRTEFKQNVYHKY